MVNFRKSAILNRAFLYSTICAFTSASIIPLQAVQENNGINLNFNDINFGIKIEKLIEKTKKCFKAKDSNKLIEVMFEIKQEIEGYTGQKIDIEKSLEQVEGIAKTKGQKIDKNHMKVLRNRFKMLEKRMNHKASYISQCIEFDLPYNVEEESTFYKNYMDAAIGSEMAKSHHGKDKDEHKTEEVVLPLRVTIGVTMILVGLFLYVVPHPVCKASAPWVMDTGLAFLADQAVTEWENNDKKKDDKK